MKSKTINQHEEVYIHLPKQSFKFFLLTILLIALTIGSFYVTIESWTFLELGDIEGNLKEDFESDLEVYHLLICPILIFNAILIGLTLFSLISMFKRLSFDKSLVWGLGRLLLGWLVFILVFVFIIGFIEGLILGLIGGLVIGLFRGLLEIKYEN